MNDKNVIIPYYAEAARVRWRFFVAGHEQQKMSDTRRRRAYIKRKIYRYVKGRRRTFCLSVKAVVHGCASNKQVRIMSRSPKVAAPCSRLIWPISISRGAYREDGFIRVRSRDDNELAEKDCSATERHVLATLGCRSPQ